MPSMLGHSRLSSAAAARRRWIFFSTRTFVDARIPWVRDRALDHAVEKEKNLLPFHSLKDLLLLQSDPNPNYPPPSSPSLPLSVISSRREDLRLPFKASRFVRLFPAALVETLPLPPAPPRPIVSATPELTEIHSDELRAHSSAAADTASRLLRLLMLCPRRRLPLAVVDRLRWDLGLPRDYPRSLLPDYPDFFQVVPSQSSPPSHDLELVLYNGDLAVSDMERYARRTGGYRKGTPLAFPTSFPRGLELEKKVRKWVDEWQKLPYLSPYDGASHLDQRSDLSEKWVVGMLHEVLSLLVPKKTEKENLEALAPHVGLRPGFKKVISRHPGIFYLSNKLKSQTVVLREAYRRDLLVQKHPLMGFRYQYIHLMRKAREADAANSRSTGSRAAGDDQNDNEDEDGECDFDEDDEEGDIDDDDEDEDEDEDDEEEEEEEKSSVPVNGDADVPYQRRRRRRGDVDSLLHTSFRVRNEAFVSRRSRGRVDNDASRIGGRRRQKKLGA